MIYHITTQKEWQSLASASTYEAASLHTEGFIHCSILTQLYATISRYYSGRMDVLILRISPEKVAPILKYELAKIGEFFPHLYGPIPKDSINGILTISDIREEILLSGRPQLQLDAADTDIEAFQNNTLRPILKLQHDVIQIAFESLLIQHNKQIHPISEEKLHYLIHDFAFTNNNWVKTIEGMIIGLFTKDELVYYMQHQSELRRRIVNMAKERIRSVYMV